MTTVKQREKRRANRMRKNKQAEVLAESDAMELPLEDDAIEKSEADPETDPLEKDYYATPYISPTSYEEMDAVKAAREQAEQVRMETYTVQDLVSNIAYSPMTPDDKSKAIVKVGKDFGSRLKAITKVEKEFVDMDLLQLKALIAKDARQTSLIEKATDFLSNSFTSQETPTKASVRRRLKDAVAILEKETSGTELTRNSVPELLKDIKELGIGASNSILIEKDASGSWRAVLFPTNNFKDRDGEILSQAAHEEYVEWINKNMDCAPVFATWHKPGTAREHPLDFVDYENGIMIASLPLTENEAARILKMQTQFDIGLSIGGLAMERDPENSKIITKYRMFEVSDLPLERAANPFTAIELISKEAQMDSKAMKEYLAGMIGDQERADKIVEKMALTQAELRKAGVEEKEVKTPEPVAAPKAAAPASVNLDELVEKLSKELGMQELSDTIASLQATAEKVPVLEALVKEMAESQDEKLAEMIQPKIQKSLSWMTSRPTQSADNILKETEEDEKLKKSAPEVSWLSEALGVQPLQIQ